MEFAFVKNIFSISQDSLGYTKELNIVEVNDQYQFCLGKFSVDRTDVRNYMFLSEKEIKELRKYLDELKETSLDKFLKDYMQQSHNGPQIHKDKYIDGN